MLCIVLSKCCWQNYSSTDILACTCCHVFIPQKQLMLSTTFIMSAGTAILNHYTLLVRILQNSASLIFSVPNSSCCSSTSSEDSAYQDDAHQFLPHLVPSTGGDYKWSHHCLHPGVWWEQWWNSSMQHLPLWRGWGAHSDWTGTSHWVLREGGSCECCWKGPLLWTSASADSTRQWVLHGVVWMIVSDHPTCYSLQ